MSFFHPDYGLRATSLASAVHERGPLRWGADHRFWAYRDGVWEPASDEVHARVVKLLGERYRPQHESVVAGVLRAVLERMEVRPAPRFINVRNGLIVWNNPTGPLLIPHEAESESTVQLPIEWDEDARCPAFEAFLSQSVDDDDQQRVWEILGYLMMSGNPLHRLFLLTGGGGNGKGVLLDVIKALLGQRNVSNVPLHEFAENRFATAEVFGKLANICGDIDSTYIEKTGLIKQLGGEDVIKAEQKYGQPFYFDFWGKMLFSANAIPVASDSSDGWLRRWEIVNFPNQPAKPDLGLKARLTQPECLQGIAVRAVAALPALMERKTFAHGMAASRAHLEFAQRNNKLLAWIQDEATYDPSSWYDRKELLSSFRAWDNHNNPGGRGLAAAAFYERLRQIRGLAEKIRRGTRGFSGLRLLRDVAGYLEMTDIPEFEDAPSSGVQDPKQGEFAL